MMSLLAWMMASGLREPAPKNRTWPKFVSLDPEEGFH